MRWLLALLFIPVCHVQADSVGVAACLQRLSNSGQQNIDISADCPALVHYIQPLDQTEFRADLPVFMSRSQLEFLHNSFQRQSPHQAVQYNNLTSLLDLIRTPDKVESEWEWWKAFMNWLKSLDTSDYESEFQWLKQFLESINFTPEAAQSTFYVLLALLVLTALWMVLNELYQIGVFRRLFQRGANPSLAEHPTASADQNGKPFSTLSPRQKINHQLQQALNFLVQKQYIPCDASLTYRQVAKRLSNQKNAKSSAFSHLVSYSEPCLYSPQDCTDSQVNECHQLLNSLLEKTE